VVAEIPNNPIRQAAPGLRQRGVIDREPLLSSGAAIVPERVHHRLVREDREAPVGMGTSGACSRPTHREACSWLIHTAHEIKQRA
jgi:hypothetical protein